MNDTIRKTFTPKFLILLLVLWQFFSVLLMSIGAWPHETVWVSMALLAAFIVFSGSYHGLLLLIVSIPWYIALPGKGIGDMSMWRVLFALEFLVWFVRTAGVQNVLRLNIRQIFSRIACMPWDKYLGIFAAVALVVTLAVGRFRAQGLQQIAFWLNVYLLYVVAVNELTTKERVRETVRFVLYAAGTIVAVGFLQLGITLLTELDYFWSYWAVFVSKLYYGQDLASVLFYSNSWFSYTGGKELRMFGILPDSHAFALVCAFALGTLLTCLYWVRGKARYGVWAGVLAVCLALVFSGTRAVWVGMLAPLVVLGAAYAARMFRGPSRKLLASCILVLVLFGILPYMHAGLQYIRTRSSGQLSNRIQSIYDLDESSNSGRLYIWKESLAAFASHPFGVGLGNFLTTLDTKAQDFDSAGNELNERFNVPQRYVTAHSLYLQLLVELGFLGFAAFSVFIVVYLRELWKFLKAHAKEDNWLIFLAIQSAAVTLWILAAAVFDVTLFNDRVLMLFFFNIALSGSVLKHYTSWNRN